METKGGGKVIKSTKKVNQITRPSLLKAIFPEIRVMVKYGETLLTYRFNQVDQMKLNSEIEVLKTITEFTEWTKKEGLTTICVTEIENTVVVVYDLIERIELIDNTFNLYWGTESFFLQAGDDQVEQEKKQMLDRESERFFSLRGDPQNYKKINT